MSKRAFSGSSISVLLLALAFLPGCGGGGKTQPASSLASNQPSQASTPSVVEQPESSGPILSNDASAMEGRDVGAGEEGPLHRIHFDYDKSDITSDAQSILNQNGDYLKGNPSTFIRIEGHCDERGSVEYNQALGERRANSAKLFLSSLGIEGTRMETISYGEDRPMAFEQNEYAWAQNRRAEFRILSE